MKVTIPSHISRLVEAPHTKLLTNEHVNRSFTRFKPYFLAKASRQRSLNDGCSTICVGPYSGMSLQDKRQDKRDVVKRVLLVGVTGILCLVATSAEPVTKRHVFPVDETTAIMKKVSDWQLENLHQYAVTANGERFIILGNDWIRCTFFIGVMAASHVTKDEKYLNAALKWAETNKWQPGRHPNFADDQCVGQTYAELYFIRKDPKMISATWENFDKMMAYPKPGRKVWWWVDSLFMAPPVLVRLSAARGEGKYLDFMNKMWWDTVEFLYDSEEHLFYRDRKTKIQKDGSGPRTQNGKKIFWGRGNGWVMAGTVRVLEYMPEDYLDRKKYIRLLKEMAEKIASLQGKDGLWRANLLDPEEHPAPETSASGLFCYALTWGINQRILEKEKYLPVVEKAWKGLVGAVDESGKLGWVQQTAAGPTIVRRDGTMEYGVGAFLLAGSEVVKLRR